MNSGIGSVFVVLVVSSWAATAAGEAAAPAPRVKVLGPLAIAIDPANNTGQTTIHLKNVGDKPIAKQLLHAGTFKSTVTQRDLGGQVLLAHTEETAGKPSYLLDKFAPGDIVSLRLIASGVWEAGSSEAPLLLDGERLAVISARRDKVPFNVRIESASTADSPLRFEQGTDQVLLLKNEDPLNYRYIWRITLGDTSLAGEKPELLTASSTTELRVKVPGDAFPGGFAGLFRDRRQTGLLEIRMVAVDGGDPTSLAAKTFPVFVRLARWPEGVATFLGGLLVFLVLVAGGLASMWLNYSVPAAVKRLALRQQLGLLAGRTKRLPEEVDLHLRVTLRVLRLEIYKRVKTERVLLPGATDTIDQAVRDATGLGQRVALIERIGRALQRIAALSENGPPRLLAQEEAKLSARLRGLTEVRVSESELQLRGTQVGEVDAMIDRIERDDSTLRGEIADAARAYWNDTFKPLWTRVGTSAAAAGSWAAELNEKMGAFVVHAGERLGVAAPADGDSSGLNRESLEWIDTAYAKLELIVGYVHFCESATPEQLTAFDQVGYSGPWLDEPASPEAGKVKQRERFLRCLSGKGRSNLTQARLVLRQAEEGIFVKDIAAQLNAGAFGMHIEPSTVQQYEVVRFRAIFNEGKFNGAAACGKLECVWTFKHGGIDFHEKGWSVCHFFPDSEDVDVRLEFRRGANRFPVPAKAGAEDDPVARTLHVYARPPDDRRERTRLELIQLGVALGATTLALLAGAREQLQKLDMWAGFAAVFALGFGSDVLKNLVSRRAAPPPPPA